MTTTEQNHLSTTTTDHTSAWTAAREFYRNRRSARAEYLRLEQELSTYRTQADIHELDAMLERSGIDADSVYTQLIERIRLRAA